MGPGERSFFMTEKFTFDDTFGDGTRRVDNSTMLF